MKNFKLVDWMLILGFDNVLDDDPLFRVIDVYRGDATWCVRVAQDDSELLFSYPDTDGIGRFTIDESYGCW